MGGGVGCLPGEHGIGTRRLECWRTMASISWRSLMASCHLFSEWASCRVTYSRLEATTPRSLFSLSLVCIKLKTSSCCSSSLYSGLITLSWLTPSLFRLFRLQPSWVIFLSEEEIVSPEWASIPCSFCSDLGTPCPCKVASADIWHFCADVLLLN